MAGTHRADHGCSRASHHLLKRPYALLGRLEHASMQDTAQPSADERPADAPGRQDLVQRLQEALAPADDARVQGWVKGLRAPDLADLIELLEPGERVRLIQ